MKALFDFFPVVAFFVTYIFFGRDIYLATAVIMVAVVLQLAILLIRYRKIERSPAITAVLILVFGGITLLLKNDLFIKLKPTVANWLFAGAFLGSHFIGDKPLVQRMLGSSFPMEAPLWNALNRAWVLFFFFVGALNLYVVYHFDEVFWVKFKLFGLIGLTFAFILAQGIWLASKVPDDKPDEKEA